MFPIKYIDNNLVWNKDNEVFAYYELIPYNYSFLSAEQKFIVHDNFRQLIAQSREGKIHALQIATESSIRSMQEQSKKLVTGKLKEVAYQKIDEQTEALVSMIGDNQVDYRFFLGFKLMVTEEQLNLKNIKRATEKGRQYLMNALKNDPLGMRAIDTVKQSDAKEWAIRMSEKGYAYKTIDNYKRSLKASFYMAIQDDCIRKNPFEFKLSDVLEDDTEQKVILTPEQEERLLAFMEKDKIYSKYYDEVVLLLETGLRISEFCGLTTHIDMQNRILNIDHQLLKDSEMGYYIETPKTKNGKRELPLTERAYQAIQRILKNRGKAQPLIVGGYSNFLFLNREGLPKVAGNYEGMVRGLIKKYNKYHTDKLPNITPHSFRHTYCTNMANRGMNPNTLQYLMGHANITMTLGYYAHGTFQSAKAELERLAC